MNNTFEPNKRFTYCLVFLLIFGAPGPEKVVFLLLSTFIVVCINWYIQLLSAEINHDTCMYFLCYIM